MGAARPAFDVARAIRSARKGGFEPREVIVTPTGEIRLRVDADTRDGEAAGVLREIEVWDRGRR